MKKRKHLVSYFYSMGIPDIYLAGLSNAFVEAEKDGIEELVVTATQFQRVKEFMSINGFWNWDKKTFWGMTFVIED